MLNGSVLFRPTVKLCGEQNTESPLRYFRYVEHVSDAMGKEGCFSGAPDRRHTVSWLAGDHVYQSAQQF